MKSQSTLWYQMDSLSNTTDPQATEIEWPDTDNSSEAGSSTTIQDRANSEAGSTEESKDNVGETGGTVTAADGCDRPWFIRSLLFDGGSTEESKHDVAPTGEIEEPLLSKKPSKTATLVWGFVAAVAAIVVCHRYLVPTTANHVIQKEEGGKYLVPIISNHMIHKEKVGKCLPQLNTSTDLIVAKDVKPHTEQALATNHHSMSLNSIKFNDMQQMNAQVQNLTRHVVDANAKMQIMIHESWKMNDTVNDVLQKNDDLVRLNGMLKMGSDAKMQKMINAYQKMNDTVYEVLQQNVALVRLNSKLQMENDAKYKPEGLWNRVAGVALGLGSAVAFNWLRPSLSAVAIAQAQNLMLVEAPQSTSAALALWAREGLQQLIGLDSRMVLAKLTESSYRGMQLSHENSLLHQQIGQTYEWLSELNMRNQDFNQVVSALEKEKQDLEKANQWLNDRNIALEKANQDSDVECIMVA